MLAHKLGNNRLATLIDASVFLIVPILGASLLSYFPKPVLGSLPLFLGLSQLWEWVVLAWFKLTKSDYLIVQLIWIISATVEFLQGSTVGWLMAIALVAISSVRNYFTKSRT